MLYNKIQEEALKEIQFAKLSKLHTSNGAFGAVVGEGNRKALEVKNRTNRFQILDPQIHILCVTRCMSIIQICITLTVGVRLY